MKRELMDFLIKFLVVNILFLNIAFAENPIKIEFFKGEVAYWWEGQIYNYKKQNFTMALKKGQRIRVCSPNLTGWSGFAPNGERLFWYSPICDDKHENIAKVSGEFLIVVDGDFDCGYRVPLYDCPPDKKGKKAEILFQAF